MKIAILNNTGHLMHAGCKLVMQAFEHMCKKHDMQIICSVPSCATDLTPFYPEFKKADLLVVNGEGSIHHDNRPELISVAKYFPTALINAVFQANELQDGIEDFKYIAVRESLSAKQVKGAYIVPDLVYAAPFWESFKRPSDKVTNITVTDCAVGRERFDIPFEMAPQFLASVLTRSKRVCTGRFHGAVFCSILNIPFSAYNGNTHKIEGLCIDMKAPWLYYPSRGAALKQVPHHVLPSVRDYVKGAKARIEQMFKDLRAL